jgi:GAF domain-containing protein
VTSPSDEPQDTALVTAALAELGRLSFLDHSMPSVLDRVAALARQVLAVQPAASVTVLTGIRPVTVASTEQLALDLDEAQYRIDAGPCLEAARTGHPVEVADLRAEQRWAGFVELAAQQGCQGILSVPFPRRGPAAPAGGLNVYVRTSDAWDPATRRRAEQFATAAVVPVANHYLYQNALDRAEHLTAALSSRAVIDQAKGILMERFRISADQAFQALARRSMATNTKLRDIADRVVATGEFPAG